MSARADIVVPDVARRIAQRLAVRYAGTFSPETIQRTVDESYRLLAEGAAVRQHLASLTARFAADRLAALVRADDLQPREIPSVLFVCVENSARSQLAAAVMRALAGERVTVMSAGSQAAGRIAPGVAEVLDEVGIPVRDEYPKPLTDELVRGADYVITMGCGDACPVFPGRRYEDWDVADPIGAGRSGMRRTRDEVIARVEALLSGIGVPTISTDVR